MEPLGPFAKELISIKFIIYVIIPRTNMHNTNNFTFPEQRQKQSPEFNYTKFIASDARFCWYKIGAKIEENDRNCSVKRRARTLKTGQMCQAGTKYELKYKNISIRRTA